MNKPTKPGFYWYKEYGREEDWQPVKVYLSAFKETPMMSTLGNERDWPVAESSGEWGPEIVHVD